MRVLRSEGGRVVRGGRELARPGAPIWIDCAPTSEDLAWLGETFGFHPLALEDCAHEDQRAKFDQYPAANGHAANVFCVVHRLAPAPDESGVETHELDAFLTPEALVTVHQAPIAEIDAIFERCGSEPALLARGPDFTLYLVHDALTDAHWALVDALAAEVEALADAVAEPKDPARERDLLAAIVTARRAHLALRRRLAPQREVFAALARPGQGLVSEATAIYFRDVVDHAVRLAEEIDTGRDLLAGATDVYLNAVNNRLSRITAQLTIVATVFLPLNFVAGFFGMNLHMIPERIAVPFVWACVVLFPIAMVVFFRRKRWL
jgi:magnesium transporter